MKNYILTITPNPALDLGGVVDKIVPNEKSYVHNPNRSPGGNAINAARILTRLKIPVLATGFLGGGTGDEIRSLLVEEGVKNNFIQIKGASRICVTVSNRLNHQQTRLTFPGPIVSPKELRSLFQVIENAKNIPYLIIGGSLPEGFRSSDLVRMMRVAKKNQMKCIVDCPTPLLRTLIQEGPILIKPNLQEFQELTKSKVTTIGSVHKKAQMFLRKVPYICVSSVEGGALLVTKENSYFGRIPHVKIRSTVGAGDSMIGAMVGQLFKKNASSEDILRWGLASAAATLTQPGTAFGSAKDILKFYKSVNVEPVGR